ncbi:MAG: guanylate kinase [Propionibacteriaceae bacterium]|nr:guanylate kinase [Propionibacteriaceae bacterium]
MSWPPVILTGPSGVGKGTVVAALVARCPEIWVSVSATTREPRPGERPGQSYHFCSEAEFDHLIERDRLLEWATVHGQARYGTPAQPVHQALAAGRPVLLELDLAGARSAKARLPQARSVFLAPPSWPELVRRLSGRGTESPADQARRLATARAELACADEFDVVLVNREVDETVTALVRFFGFCHGPNDQDQE